MYIYTFGKEERKVSFPPLRVNSTHFSHVFSPQQIEKVFLFFRDKKRRKVDEDERKEKEF